MITCLLHIPCRSFMHIMALEKQPPNYLLKAKNKFLSYKFELFQNHFFCIGTLCSFINVFYMFQLTRLHKLGENRRKKLQKSVTF